MVSWENHTEEFLWENQQPILKYENMENDLTVGQHFPVGGGTSLYLDFSPAPLIRVLGSKSGSLTPSIYR